MARAERQSGVALLMALVCVMVMTLFAMMMFEPIRAETVLAGAAKDDMMVFYAAEAGIETAAADLLQAKQAPASGEFTLGRATVRYTISKISGEGERFLVTAEGLLPSRRERAVKKTLTAEMILHTGDAGRRVEALWRHVQR
ncbi:MAG: hypothetical protein AB1696_12205 [Planctomycetota bacterium]